MCVCVLCAFLTFFTPKFAHSNTKCSHEIILKRWFSAKTFQISMMLSNNLHFSEKTAFSPCSKYLYLVELKWALMAREDERNAWYRIAAPNSSQKVENSFPLFRQSIAFHLCSFVGPESASKQWSPHGVCRLECKHGHKWYSEDRSSRLRWIFVYMCILKNSCTEPVMEFKSKAILVYLMKAARNNGKPFSLHIHIEGQRENSSVE